MEKIKAVFDKDTKKFHRYLVKPGGAITGVLYISKDTKIPEEVTVLLETKAYEPKE